MSHYCHSFDAREIFNPFRALRRALEGGTPYWKVWAIGLTAFLLSFLGLAALGVGFVFSSVWFWQVAGFSFALAFSKRFALVDGRRSPTTHSDSNGLAPPAASR
jgi:hypothetical protein